MTREHFWPIWLINHAEVRSEGIAWAQGPNSNPRSATVPLCRECNHRLGAELEGPVSTILHTIERGEGISDKQAELLVRWLWKFEALSAAYAHLSDPHWRYSDRWSPVERVLGNPIEQVRNQLVLAIGLINQNDQDHEDWPMGVDSGLSVHDAFHVAGVFKRTAVMVSLRRFQQMIPSCFGVYQLKDASESDSIPCFFPPTCFPYSNDAIEITKATSALLKAAHEEIGREANENRLVHVARRRIEIPNH